MLAISQHQRAKGKTGWWHQWLGLNNILCRDKESWEKLRPMESLWCSTFHWKMAHDDDMTWERNHSIDQSKTLFAGCSSLMSTTPRNSPSPKKRWLSGKMTLWEDKPLEKWLFELKGRWLSSAKGKIILFMTRGKIGRWPSSYLREDGPHEPKGKLLYTYREGGWLPLF